MKQLTLLLLSLITFTSCRKDFASFQKSPNLSYSHQKNSLKNEVLLAPTETILLASVDNFSVFPEKTDIFSSKIIDIELEKSSLDDGRRRKNKKNINKKEGTFIEKIFPNKTHQDKQSVKKRRKPIPLNSTIYTGFIILVIAILLALLSLNSLSLLFGVAAILFLYLGFKKYFRKKRRRDIFR